MVRFIHNFKSWRNYRRCQKAIRKADMLKLTTRKKQLVIMYGGRPEVISKERLKEKVREGFFQPGITVDKIESMAIYKTL